MQAFVAFCCGQKPRRLQSSVSERKSPKRLQSIHGPLFTFYVQPFLACVSVALALLRAQRVAPDCTSDIDLPERAH